METSSPSKFWIEASAVEDACGRRKFEEIAKLAFAFLSLPFANADVERAFSLTNHFKTKIRNRLSVRMVEAILCVRYHLLYQKIGLSDFKPSQKMLDDFRSDILYVDVNSQAPENFIDVITDSFDGF